MSDAESDPRPWWRQPSTLVVLALFVLAAGIGIGLIVSSGDDGDGVSTTGTAPPSTTSTTLAPTTTAVTSTTAPARDRCVAGDQEACDQLEDDELDELCDGGNGSLDACQVLLAHQGDGVPDGTEVPPQGSADPED
jgi:sugar/nucleoside kinase (ribokinase family)